jgi:ABC-type antimicrobial peptide transport system permease subunit
MKSFLVPDNYRMAIDSIYSSKVRSFLTMLGIIIGVVSVVTAVSLGEGVKNQVSEQISRLGNDLITIQPGKLVERDKTGRITKVNLLSTLGRGTLSEDDLKSVRAAKSVKETAPLNLITGAPKIGDKTFSGATVIATTDNLPGMINQELEFGGFFSEDDINQNTAIIGRSIAISFFDENVPIGKTMIIRGHEFVVGGIFEKFDANPIDPTLDLNSTIFIPFKTGKEIAGGSTHIFQIFARADTPSAVSSSANSITAKIRGNHGGQDDFTVLKQEDTLAIAQSVVSLITGLVAGIAAISLLIGGIGIMNIMLVSVSERTREIGVRKAIGATNKQIMSQFLIEAIVLTVWGALAGLFISLLANIGIRIFTDLQPAITPQVVLVATIVSIVVGIVFGIAPAIKAALKDPIESLRASQ